MSYKPGSRVPPEVETTETAQAEENEEKMIADKRIWEFIELVARGNTEMLELEKLASNLIEEKYENEQTIDSGEEVVIAMDGNQWCATRKSFRNLMEDIAGFGDTPVQAIVNLVFNEGVELMAPLPIGQRRMVRLNQMSRQG